MDRVGLLKTIVFTSYLSALLGITLNGSRATAVTFEQQEIDQKKLIAIAVPVDNGSRYNLLILEQISSLRPCWQEQGGQPAIVDPLLVNFDFTNICGRSTDSNGYSIRLAGEDLALKYSLRVVRQDGELVLLGIPHKQEDGMTLEIGRTQGVGQGLHKIILDPGWRFTRRTYQGKPLGHIYLTQDQTFPETVATSRRGTPASSLRRPQVAAPIPVATSRTGVRSIPVVSSVASQSTVSAAPAIMIPVPPPDSGPTIRGRSIPPSPRRASPAAALPQLPADTIPIAVPPPASGASPSPSPTTSDLNPSNLLPVPSAKIPLGNAGDDADVYAAGNSLNPATAAPPPPPIPAFLLGPRYRVVVETSKSSEQSQIRTLVPGAFRSFYGGRSVMQVGSFQERGKADEMMQMMQSNGFHPILEAVQ